MLTYPNLHGFSYPSTIERLIGITALHLVNPTNINEISTRNTKMQENSTSSKEAPVREFLAFKLGDEEYGIDILKVQEIRGYEQPTRMAGVPPRNLIPASDRRAVDHPPF